MIGGRFTLISIVHSNQCGHVSVRREPVLRAQNGSPQHVVNTNLPSQRRIRAYLDARKMVRSMGIPYRETQRLDGPDRSRISSLPETQEGHIFPRTFASSTLVPLTALLHLPRVPTPWHPSSKWDYHVIASDLHSDLACYSNYRLYLR